ncbi:MAG: hypothetical protein ABII12_09515 [Planctomycetota bacterium]
MNSAEASRAANRRRLVVVSTTLACLLAVDVLVRMGDGELSAFYVDPYQRKLDKLQDLSVKPDVILIGSSRTNYGLVPEEFERLTRCKTFNLAVPASKVLEWRLLARACVDRARPRLVVLGVNASTLRADYLPVPAARHLFTDRDMIDYCLSDGWSNEVVGHYLDRRIGPAWALFHRRFEVKMLIQEQAGCILPKYAQLACEQRQRTAKPCPNDGFEHPWLYGRRSRSLQAQLDKDGDAAVWAASVPAFSPDARAIGHFDALLSWFGEQRIPLIVAYIPNSPRTTRRWKSVEPVMIETLASLCHNHDVPFVPWSRDGASWRNQDYIEELHAGLPLARRMSRRIAERIVALGLQDDGTRRITQIPEDDATLP